MEHETDETVGERARTIFDNIGFVIVPMIALGLLALLVFFWKFDRSADYCPTRVMRLALSPNGEKAAVVAYVNCGNLVEDRRVAIADPDRLTNAQDYATVFKTTGRVSISIVWLNDETLKITLPKDAIAKVKKSKIYGVSIVYD